MRPAASFLAKRKEQADGNARQEAWWRDDRCRSRPHGRQAREREIRLRVLREDRKEGRLEHRGALRPRLLREDRAQGRQGRQREVRRRPLRADRSAGRPEGRVARRACEAPRGGEWRKARAPRAPGPARGDHRGLILPLVGKEPDRIGTRVVRTARVLPSGAGTPLVPPLVQSVAFDYGSMDEQDAIFANERPGWVYGRYGTPTTAALEAGLAELDGVEEAVCFVSGMAAIAALFGVVSAEGGRIVAQEDTYGATRAMLQRFAVERKADVAFVDPTDLGAVDRALKQKTALLYVEAISNPLLRVTDVAALADRAHAAGARLCVDATFATPVLYRPTGLGADLVLHSLTKYLNGHGDVMGGSVGGPRGEIAKLRERVMSDGAYLPPHA